MREALGWSDFAVCEGIWLRLVELEYVLAYRTGRGNEREYELLYHGEGRDGKPFLLGLIDVGTLQKTQYEGRPQRTTTETSGLQSETSPIRAPSEPLSSPIRAPRKMAQVHATTIRYGKRRRII